MRDYGRVRTKFWEWAARKSLGERARLLAVYLLSTPHGNPAGVLRLPSSYIGEDLGWNTETVNLAVSELAAVGFIKRDDASGWTWIVGFLDHNAPANDNVGKAIASVVEGVPVEVPFFQEFIASLKPLANRFPNGFLNRMTNRSPNGSETVTSTVSKRLANRSPNGSETVGEPPPNGFEIEEKRIGENRKEDTRPNRSIDAPGFAEWYAAYPKHVARGDAEKAYRGALKLAPADALLAGARRLAERSIGADRKFIKHPASWLRAKCWLDDTGAGSGPPASAPVDDSDPYRGVL